MVEFECAVGVGLGLWKGDGVATIGEEHFVELDVDVVVRPGKNAELREHGTFTVYRTNEHVIVEGRLESQDEDNLGYLRLSEDCLLMFEAESAFPPETFVAISIAPSLLSIWPCGY